MWGPARNGQLPKLALVLDEFAPRAPGAASPWGLAPEVAYRRISTAATRGEEMQLARDVEEFAQSGKLTARSAAARLAGEWIAAWRDGNPDWWKAKGQARADEMHEALHDAIYRAWIKHRDDLAEIFASEPPQLRFV
jgi:hypothetical protein